MDYNSASVRMLHDVCTRHEAWWSYGDLLSDICAWSVSASLTSDGPSKGGLKLVATVRLCAQRGPVTSANPAGDCLLTLATVYVDVSFGQVQTW
jgi:hypothetical protein